MEVYLIRHTRPKVDKGICYGQSDLSLQNTFKKEFNSLLPLLPSQIDCIYTSPLTRCSQLADRIGGEILYSDALKELNFGDWEMQNWNDINQTELNEWMIDFVNYKVSNGESLIELKTRVDSFWQELKEIELDKVVICSHAGPIRCLIGNVLCTEPKDYFKLEIDYGGVSKISINRGHEKIEYVNRVGQLKDI